MSPQLFFGRIGEWARQEWRQVLDWVFPPRCVSCRQVGAALCSACLVQVKPITCAICSRCGHPLPPARAACPACRLHPYSITAIRAAVWHEGPAREAIHALKYQKRRDVVSPLVQLMQPVLTANQWVIDLITAVPLHPERERERGYNQAQLLGEELARRTQRPFTSTLSRTRATQDQIGLDGTARRANVQAAFGVTDASIKTSRILIVDDVCTTGATLDACAHALVQGGARAVYGLTVTRPRSLF